jgi:hypothetical protein
MPGSSSFDHDLLLDLIKRIDAVSDKMDQKIDDLEARLSDDVKDLTELINRRIDPIDQQVRDNTQKLVKHEHNFNLLTLFVTSGMASIAGFFTWMSSLFKHSP